MGADVQQLVGGIQRPARCSMNRDRDSSGPELHVAVRRETLGEHTPVHFHLLPGSVLEIPVVAARQRFRHISRVPHGGEPKVLKQPEGRGGLAHGDEDGEIIHRAQAQVTVIL